MTTRSLVQVTIEPTHSSFTYNKQLNGERCTETFAICLHICLSLSRMYNHLKQSIYHFKQQQSLHTHTHTVPFHLSILQLYTCQHSGQTDIYDIWVPALQIHLMVSRFCQLNTWLLYLSIET
jgi:hypothetical protein